MYFFCVCFILMHSHLIVNIFSLAFLTEARTQTHKSYISYTSSCLVEFCPQDKNNKQTSTQQEKTDILS